MPKLGKVISYTIPMKELKRIQLYIASNRIQAQSIKNPRLELEFIYRRLEKIHKNSGTCLYIYTNDLQSLGSNNQANWEIKFMQYFCYSKPVKPQRQATKKKKLSNLICDKTHPSTKLHKNQIDTSMYVLGLSVKEYNRDKTIESSKQLSKQTMPSSLRFE